MGFYVGSVTVRSIEPAYGMKRMAGKRFMYFIYVYICSFKGIITVMYA